jgi:hypothetical protein
MTKTEVQAALLAAFEAAKKGESPYPHWTLTDCLPKAALDAIAGLPFSAQDVHGESGRREIHNATRSYFAADEREQYPVCAAIAEAMQDPAFVKRTAEFFKTDLDGSYLRIEYALDTDGFWLEPHTDIGVKLFTFLIYLSDGPGHDELGTDIYADKETHIGRSPFGPGVGFIFVPSNHTWHGFEKRPIQGVRRSLIINYVKPEWRAREQLAYPTEPVKAAA